MPGEGSPRGVRPVTASALNLLLLLLVAANAQGQSRDLGNTGEVRPPNDRVHVETQGNVRVTTAVPSREETRRLFGFSLYARNIQPVWVQVENLGQEMLWFLPIGVDDAYFTPIETSYRLKNRESQLDWDLNRDYYGKRMILRIEPGGKRSGYIFTRLDEGTKSFNIDVLGLDEQFRMSFLVPVPGLKLDYYNVDWDSLYSADEIRDVDIDALIEGLEALPCCVTDKGGQNNGDPLNLAVIGSREDLFYAFKRSGWDETETIYTTSLWKTAMSAMAGSEYRYSPVSALYVYGRPQDVALQKSRDSIHQRNHLRLWMTPMRFEGQPVWIGQISRDIGVRFTWKGVTTHKIDPDVDDAREYLLENLAYAQSLRAYGYVGGVGRAAFDEPSENLTGDPYYTDGLRIVLFASSEAVSLDDIKRIYLSRRAIDYIE